MKAVILCGGLGKRLRPLTNKIPKSMIFIKDKPILEHQIDYFKKSKIKEFYFCTGYKHEVIERYFKDGSKFGVDIMYSREHNQLGTAGAIKKLENDMNDECFFVVNGDTLTSANLSAMSNSHKKMKTLITIVLVQPISPWGSVEIDRNLVTGFVEKPKLSQFINLGLYIMESRVFSFLPKNGQLETDVFPKLAKAKQVSAFIHKGFWKDIETFKDLEDITKSRF